MKAEPRSSNRNGQPVDRVHRVVSHPTFQPADTKESKMNSVIARVQRFLVSEDGPTAVEYAVMLALIVVACVTIVKNLGTSISSTFSSVSSSLSTSS
jgi:pilus assembly protein Flp/PilA